MKVNVSIDKYKTGKCLLMFNNEIGISITNSQADFIIKELGLKKSLQRDSKGRFVKK